MSHFVKNQNFIDYCIDACLYYFDHFERNNGLDPTQSSKFTLCLRFAEEDLHSAP